MRSIVFAVVLSGLIGCAAQSPSSRARMKSPKDFTPEQMQAAFEKASSLRPEHKALEPLIGTYSVSSKMWMDPQAQPEVATGSTEFTKILDGRFLQQTYTSTFQGRSFAGLSLLGFNNLTGQYESTWADSMGTQIMKNSGTADPTGKVITFQGEYDCPLIEGKRKGESVLKIGTDQHIFEMYDLAENGQKVKSLEIVYSRVAPKVETKALKPLKKKQ